jgi:hypothetical protein
MAFKDGEQTTRITTDAREGILRIEAGNGGVIELDARNLQVKMYNPNVNDGQDGVFLDGNGWIQIRKGDKQIYLNAADLAADGMVSVRAQPYCEGETEKTIDVVSGEPI